MTRVVFDTNVFISALLKRNGVCGLLLNFWRDERFVVLYSQELIFEWLRFRNCGVRLVEIVPGLRHFATFKRFASTVDLTQSRIAA